MPFAAISDSIERGFDTFFAWLPALVGALVVLIIGYFIAKFVGKLITSLLTRAGLDRHALPRQRVDGRRPHRRVVVSLRRRCRDLLRP